MKKHENKNKLKFASKLIHAGQEIDPCSRAVIEPIYLSTLYAQEELGKPQQYHYSRVGNPTRNAYEDCVAALEEGKYASAFASGVAAITAVLDLLECGDHIVVTDNVYGGTYRLLDYLQPKRKLSVSYIDATDINAVAKAIRCDTKMIWMESPSNPLLKIVDLAAIAALGQKKKILTVIDNTFATPYLQKPCTYGFDIVVHSTTKYLNGHSDVMGGIVVVKNKQDVAEKLSTMQKTCGAVPSPFDCYLTLRSIKTLAVRMQRHCENAMELAAWLERHPKIINVYYPGLPSHPQHELAKQQMAAFGGVVTIVIKGDLQQTKNFLQRCELFPLTASLGGVESLVSHPATMSHSSLSAEERQRLGIVDNLVRLSVGIEDVADLRQDLQNALQ